MPLPAPTDDESEAFVAELLRHKRRIHLFIASLLVNPTDIEDVYQQTSHRPDADE
jgi:DNA-directed RNA polymerase specialized sigma24 family protein